MEMFLMRHDEWLLHYNCSFFDYTKIPLDQREHKIMGSTIFLLAVMIELMYVPVVFSLHKHSRYPCYNMMRFIAIIDMILITLNGLFAGISLYQGWTFCTSPTPIYILTTVISNLWYVFSLASVFLAFNRCMEMFSSELGKTLFHGKRIYLWQLVPMLYGFYFFWYEKPVVLSSVWGGWFFNPYAGIYDDYVNYTNHMHTFNNLMVVFCLTILYITFYVALGIKTSILRSQANVKKSKRQYSTFVQVLIISSVIVISAAFYDYIQYFKVSIYLTLFASYVWLFIHGVGAIVYLFLNETIRRDSKKLLGLTKLTGNNVISVIKLRQYRIGTTTTSQSGM